MRVSESMMMKPNEAHYNTTTDHKIMHSISFYSHLLVLLAGWYEDNWYEVNLKAENISCTKEQMREAAEGHLTTEALMWNQNNHQKTISGMSSDDFR